MLAPLKALLFALTAVSYFTVVPLACLVGFSRFIPRLVSWHARFCAWFMGLRVRFHGAVPRDENFLMVANHMSYLDVLGLAAHLPTRFVTSVEMRDTPFLGQIARLAGCLFVERRSRDNLSREVMALSDALGDGERVLVFPEATSTDGSSVLRFRRPLFQAALDAGVRVLPLCLNYRRISGQDVTAKNRDDVCWYGDMGFVGHLWGVFQHHEVVLEVDVLEPFGGKDEFFDAPQAAQRAWFQVSGAYRPFPGPGSGLDQAHVLDGLHHPGVFQVDGDGELFAGALAGDP